MLFTSFTIFSISSVCGGKYSHIRVEPTGQHRLRINIKRVFYMGQRQHLQASSYKRQGIRRDACVCCLVVSNPGTEGHKKERKRQLCVYYILLYTLPRSVGKYDRVKPPYKQRRRAIELKPLIRKRIICTTLHLNNTRHAVSNNP